MIAKLASRKAVLLTAVVGLTLLPAAAAFAADGPKRVGPDPAAYAKTVSKGVNFLVSRGQAEDGSFSSFAGTGPTSLAITALLRSGRTPNDPAVAKGLKYLSDRVRENGAICGKIPHFMNYETCAAIMCFREAGRTDQDKALLAKARDYLRGIQWDEGNGHQKSDTGYGGIGYGGKSRPDLSNTAYVVDALKACGAESGDEAIQKALAFVSRCQNLETEHNSTPFAAKINDGGFYYTCMIGKQDEKRMTPNGGLRSYGSMTYSGLKSMIYAGLTEDDPRVKAAVTWIRKHYDVKSNPGMGDAGLYYYYQLFAKALHAMGEDYVEDAAGLKHDWRRELAEELAARQKEDGSWVNTDRRWMETDPNLVTSFALLALSYCRPPAE